MTRDKIGVQMRQKNVLNFEFMFGSKRNVLVSVALRINHRRRARLLLPNHVGSMSKARQVELLENHAVQPSLTVAESAVPDSGRLWVPTLDFGGWVFASLRLWTDA